MRQKIIRSVRRTFFVIFDNIHLKIFNNSCLHLQFQTQKNKNKNTYINNYDYFKDTKTDLKKTK